MWNYIHNNCIIPSSMNIISIGAPSHTMKYFHIQHLINTKGSLSINVLNDVFQNQYIMKPSDKCQLTLNSCGKSKRSIFINSPYGGITTLSEEINTFGNVSMKGQNNISFQIQNCRLQITENAINIQAPIIRLKGQLQVDTQNDVIKNIKTNTNESDNDNDNEKTKDKQLIHDNDSYTVGDKCHFQTIKSVLEFIELKSVTSETPVYITLKNDKVYHETINITRGNIHFVGEKDSITCFGSWYINTDTNSGHKISFKNINFKNIDNIYERNKIKIISETNILFHNCSFESIILNLNSLSVYIKNCSFFNINEMVINTTNESHLLYSEFYINTDTNLSINGKATIWIFCVSSTQTIIFDKQISLKKMINII